MYVPVCARTCVCKCKRAGFVCLPADFLQKERECVHIMAHGYLKGQFYATFQLLPKCFFFSLATEVILNREIFTGEIHQNDYACVF